MTKGTGDLDIRKMVRESARRRVLVHNQSGETHTCTTAEHVFTALFANAINKLQPKAIKLMLKFIQMYILDQPQLQKEKGGTLVYVACKVTPEQVSEWKALGYMSAAYSDDPMKIPEQVLIKAYKAEQKALKAE